jgi:rhodanese-related sulfurtransferase
MCFRFHGNHLLFALKEVKDFMVRCARPGVKAGGRIFPLSKERIMTAMSLRSILAISLIFCAGLFISYFFLAVSPQKTPLPSTPEKSAVEKTGERVDPFARDSSEKDSAHLYVSMESVRSMLKRKQDILFIDVRGREAFEKFRLPGSIRIPLYALRTKSFLKDKALVLVHEGYPDLVLEQTSRELRAAGFANLSILNGGLRYWQQKNGPIEGDLFAAGEVSRIAPIVFFAHKDSGQWLVITVSSSAVESAEPPLPGARQLAWEGSPAKFASRLKALIANRANPALLSVLVCDESGVRYEEIDRAVQQEQIGKVFYLSGGMKGYAAFIEQQALLRQPDTEAVKRCATCS